jgi:hypothetical protein
VVICLEILTVFVVGPLAVLVCYDIAKRNHRASIVMIVVATCELYGGTYRTSALAILAPVR